MLITVHDAVIGQFSLIKRGNAMKAIYELIAGSVPFILIISAFQLMGLFELDFILAFVLFGLYYTTLWSILRWFFIEKLGIDNYCESPCSIKNKE